MSKIELNNIINTQNVQVINDNFQKIEDVINEKMLSRKPEGEPNSLQAPLDLNNQRILNAPKPTQPTDLVRLQDAQDITGGDVSGKQDVLVSGVNIKTVNNESLLGSGNLTIASSGGTTDHSQLINRTLPDQHSISSITGLQAELASKAASAHTHTVSEVVGLQASLDGKASSTHTHAIADVTGLQSALNGKAASSHTHVVADVTGLQTALDSKQATLVSGTNIKTINGTSVIGSGDLAISGSGTTDHSVLTNRNIADQHPISAITGLQSALDSKASTSHSHVIADTTGLQTALDSKQATLVSGTNIKTINGTSVLGSGDITVSGGGSSDWVSQTAAFTAAVNTNYYVTVSSVTNVTLATPSAGKFFSISNNPASSANIRIVKTGITVSSSKGTVGTADDILVAPGQHFYAYATSNVVLRIPSNG